MLKINKHSGFTIFELLITVTVLAIVMAIATPSFTYTIANSRVKTAASDFHADMMLARSEAITQRIPVAAFRNADGWMIRVMSTPNEDIRDIDDLSPDIFQMCNINATPAPETCPTTGVVYDRNGRADPRNFEMRFLSLSQLGNVQMRCVQLSLSGRPSVLTDTNNNWADGCN